MKRLVLLVEGEGDVEAAPVLLGRLLQEYRAFDAVFLDGNPFRVGEFSKISKDNFGEWRRYLKAAAKRGDLGGCLLLLDGDSAMKIKGQPFCAMRAARLLVAEARKVGAGHLFSLAIVFARMEFESWLIAGAQSLVGRQFASGGNEILPLREPVPLDPDSAPRDAKGWFRRVAKNGYRPARDQAELTRLVDLNLLRQCGPRSFQRLEKAIQELVSAVRAGEHVATPKC